jgi:OOP family OmpA-OmpF porin
MVPKIKISIFALGFLALASCSSTPPVNELPTTADANSEMTKLDGEIKDAHNKQVNVLAPQNYEKATDSLDKAREARNHNKDQKTVLHMIAVSRAYLDKANQEAAVGTQVLPGVVKQRQAAIDAQVEKYYPKEFTLADNDLRDAASAIEDHDTSVAEKNRGNLEARYSDLELSSIKKAKLGAAADTMEEARKEGAEKLIPQSFKDADTKMKADDAAVTNNRHNSAIIEAAAADANTISNRTLTLVRHAKATTEENPEQIAKQWEKDQMSLKQVNGRMGETEKTVAALASQNQKLNEATKVDREYDFATKQFSKGEAEVYKQGDKLVLRLRGLTFPKDQAVITTENYPLLAKVQKIIQASDPQTVVIEGHTDSTGSKAVNLKLSDARAKAVESYLVSNNSIKDDLVTAQGFGDTRPLASNKTSKGRAQNRRVDIISGSNADRAPKSTTQTDHLDGQPNTQNQGPQETTLQ